MVSTRAGGNGTAQDSLHLANEVVDKVLALAELSTLNERAELADLGASKSVGELEGLCRQNTQRAVPGEQRSGGGGAYPEEVRDLLEVRADGGDLVDNVLDGDDAVLSEGTLDDSVGGKGDALLVDLAVSTLVDELADGLEVGLSAGRNKAVGQRCAAGTGPVERRTRR